MDANGLISKLKASGTEKDLCDLEKVFEEYKTVFVNLSSKDQGSFALNVLCVLCRNLEKVPQWRDNVDNKSLLILAIECVRGTRNLVQEDRVKALACIYHIHRHVVRQNSLIPTELVLKFSYMPFECDNTSLLKDYYKTYWSILAERLTYIEKLKSLRTNITKLLPKFIEDVLRVIKMYDPVQFSGNFLVFVMKKLHAMFTDCSEELSVCFQKIFDVLAKKGVDSFRNLKERDALSLYEKFNECFVVVVENGVKTNFKGLHLDDIVRCCANMLGHHSDIFHCLQTFYLNAFCCIFSEKALNDSPYVDTILRNIIVSCETAEKLGYKATMYATYPYLNQFLRIYIESKITERDFMKNDYSESVQINCLKFMLLLMKKLKYASQLLKCENCPIKSGLHDALRLSFLVKNFISLSVTKGIDLKNVLPRYYNIVKAQYLMLNELRLLGCSNFNKCFRKLQTDVHNTAITLNKAQYYEFSIKIFDIYLVNEIKNFNIGCELRNLTRGLYNKSICELDYKLHEQALNDAFLSLVLANSEPSTDKYMSLVMDIKAKMLKSVTESTDDNSIGEENQDNFQMLTVLDVTKMLLEGNSYGDLRPFVKNLKFSALLKHEFSMYVKLWPSIVPIAGVWRALRDLVNGKHKDWLPVVESTEVVLKVLCEVVLETPSAVRTIHSDYYKEIVAELVGTLEGKSKRSPDEDVVFASLLLLKSEYDMADASQKYAWKATEHITDPDGGEAIRTFPQEHHASACAVRAVEVWTGAVKCDLKANPLLQHALRIAEVYVHQFLYMSDAANGLQLAHVCCELALRVGDKESYLSNAGVIISHAERESKFVTKLIRTASTFVTELLANARTLDPCLVYICELAIFYNKLELFGVSAKLVGFVQATILDAFETQANINLDLSVGRLMEAQCELAGEKCEQTILSSVNNIQRHYIAVPNSGSTFTSRRLRSLHLRHRASLAGVRAAHAAWSLRLYRRARAAAAGLPRAAAARQAALYVRVTNVAHVEDTQIKIDNRLKHILGLQPSNETQPYCLATQSIKHETFTPKTSNVETMLDSMAFKKVQTSPSVPCLPTFKMPEFFQHDKSCKCYACETLLCDVIASLTCGLEASMYFRMKEFDTARSYYEGALKMFELTEGRFKNKMAVYKSKGFNENVLDIVSCGYRKDFREILIQFLIDASLFELAQKFYDRSDDYIVRIHEIISEMRNIDPYIETEVYNLMVASAHVRKVVKVPECGLEIDFEGLKLSDQNNEILKTPESKCLPVNATPKVVKPEEVPNVKLKVIKLNLDDNSDEVENQDVKIKPKRDKKPQFKVPIPVTAKPDLEIITPRPSRSKPTIMLTQPSLDIENTPKDNEFFTPKSTPHEEMFFTPMTSVKTYGKKSNIVKKLEAEFLTPKSVKNSTIEAKESNIANNIDNKKIGDESMKTEIKNRSSRQVENQTENKKKVETGSMKSLRDKRSLKRATSPGKLVEEEKPTTTRSRRRQPLDIK